jgi:hypothetical protein
MDTGKTDTKKAGPVGPAFVISDDLWCALRDSNP